MTETLFARFTGGCLSTALMMLVVIGFRHVASDEVVRAVVARWWAFYRSDPKAARRLILQRFWFLIRHPVLGMRAGMDWGADHVSPAQAYQWALVLFHLKGIARIAWWDVAQPLAYWIGWRKEVADGPFITWANCSFQAMACIASIVALWSLWAAIPKRERADWGLLQAPFYPWTPNRPFRRRVGATWRR